MSRLYLHEVVLHPERSPRELLRALTNGTLGRVAVAAMCAVDASGNPDTWQFVVEATKRFPLGVAPVDTLIVPIDVTAVFGVYSAIVCGEDPYLGPDGTLVGDLDHLFDDGPLAPPPDAPFERDTTHIVMAGWLADMFHELRVIGEETGLRVVVITTDARSERGRGPMQRSHYFRDGRVRSTIGDAGRYYAHERYRVEENVTTWTWPRYTAISDDKTEDGGTIHEEYPGQVEYESQPGDVVVIKDEGEGLGAGRIIHRGPPSSSRPRWRRQKKPSSDGR